MQDLTVLFCRPDAPQGQADSFDLERFALDEVGIEAAWTSMESIVDDPDFALAHLDEAPGRTWLYRGWMLSEEEYCALSDAVEARGERLFVTPDEYVQTLYLPNYYDQVAAYTARSVWTNDADPREAWEAASTLAGPPWFVKDHVKSAKEDWTNACIVPEGSGEAEFVATCEALLDLRAERFERGFVVREWLSLAELGEDGPNGAPLYDEHRLVYFDGSLVDQAPYHDIEAAPAPAEAFRFLERIEAPFFTADVARTTGGEWKLIELNDGGVSVLPPLMDPRVLYRHVADWRG